MNWTSFLSVAPGFVLRTRTILPPDGAIAAAAMRWELSSEIASNTFLTESPVAALIFDTTSGSR